jgi:hypothetical protein
MDPYSNGAPARATLAAAAAAALASLSSSEAHPEEVVSCEPFEASEVDFDGEDWIDHLDRVQDWLRLEQRIEHYLSTPQVLRELFVSLGKSGMPGNIETNGILLTAQGLEHFVDRLERAVVLRDRFLSDLEDHTVKAASQRWVEAWDDAAETPSTEPIRAKVDTWPILTFVGRANRGQLDLNPTYQRGDVWPTKDAQLLIASILRGIPLPSIIVLRPDSIATAPWEVVDGKQRLTSILRFIGAHPAALRTVRAAEAEHPSVISERLFREDYPAFRRAWRKATGQTLTATLERQLYFPFTLPKDLGAGTDLARLAGSYYSQIRDEIVLVGGGESTVYEVFEGTSDYKVPIIEYVEATPRQIHEVFNLYNKQGKHLNAEEIRNAVYHDLDIMRALASMADDGPGWADAAPFLAEVAAQLTTISEALVAYGIPDDRFKRTKVLSWVASILLSSPAEGGYVRKLSTAQQINKFLDRALQRNDPMRAQATVRDAVALLARTVTAHRSTNLWSPMFCGKARNGWEELPLVASLIGTALVVAAHGDQAEQVLATHSDEIRARSAEQWIRPIKTQTALQWSYIADVALGVLDATGTSPALADGALRARFQHSPVGAFDRILADKILAPNGR